MIRTKIRTGAAKVGVAAGLLGGVTGLALVGPSPVSLFQPANHSAQVEDVSGPCDEAENATKPECVGSTTGPQTTSTTVRDTTSTTVTDSTPPTPATSSFDAAGAGTVSYRCRRHHPHPDLGRSRSWLEHRSRTGVGPRARPRLPVGRSTSPGGCRIRGRGSA